MGPSDRKPWNPISGHCHQQRNTLLPVSNPQGFFRSSFPRFRLWPQRFQPRPVSKLSATFAYQHLLVEKTNRTSIHAGARARAEFLLGSRSIGREPTPAQRGLRQPIGQSQGDVEDRKEERSVNTLE